MIRDDPDIAMAARIATGVSGNSQVKDVYRVNLYYSSQPPGFPSSRNNSFFFFKRSRTSFLSPALPGEGRRLGRNFSGEWPGVDHRV